VGGKGEKCPQQRMHIWINELKIFCLTHLMVEKVCVLKVNKNYLSSLFSSRFCILGLPTLKLTTLWGMCVPVFWGESLLRNFNCTPYVKNNVFSYSSPSSSAVIFPLFNSYSREPLTPTSFFWATIPTELSPILSDVWSVSAS
jgi:hypothetical protein